MIGHLKLKKAVWVIILGIVALVAAKIMEGNKTAGASFLLGFSGALLVLGALLLLYPILFAKKVDGDGKKVELTPVELESSKEEDSA